MTCSTSEVPMPCASAPNAPCVLVWLSPHTTVMPGRVAPFSGPMTCTMPWRLCMKGKNRGGRDLRHVLVQRGDLLFADRIGDAVVALFPAGGGRVVVGGLMGWCADLAVSFSRRPSRLCGLVTRAQMPVDVEDGRAIFFGVDNVPSQDLVVEGASRRRGLFRSLSAGWQPIPGAIRMKL